MKTLHYSILLAVLVVIMSSFVLTNANALPPFLQTDKTFHVKGDIILVYGSVGNYVPNMNATIQILDNKNNLLLNSTTTPKDDGTFLVRIPTNDTNWKTGGPYKISVQYGTCCHVGDSTFTFYTGLLPPLKQAQLGTVFWDIACNSGLVNIMKQEDGSVACVSPGDIQKLVSQNWGYDPSDKLTTYGLKDVYQIGQEIDFKFRINGFGNSCEQPSVLVRNSTQQIVWQSEQYASGCATSEDSHMKNEAFLGNLTHLEYDYNGYGILTIKQSGTYFMNISWLDGNITKKFTVIANPSSVKLDKILLDKTDSASSLKLYLSSSPGTIKSGQTVDISISVNNTSKNPVQVDAQNAWSFGSVQTGLCARIGYGISVLDGYYTIGNLTHSASIPIFNPAVMCPFIAEHAQRYEFQPSSGLVKEIKCDQDMQCNPDPYAMGHSYSFSGYWNAGQIIPFKSGVYTIVGADEWGHVAIQHFVVTNNTGTGGLDSASCDTSYVQSTGIPVMYMPANSTGKVCVQYTNPNPPVQEGIKIFEAHGMMDNAQGVSVSGTPGMIPTGNSTIVYTITSGNHVGFYGLTVFCYGMPFAIGYDGNSTFVPSDFPWYGGTYNCPLQDYDYHILGLSGIGVKYIPFP